METINAIGRRKAAVARVYFKKGAANAVAVVVNGKPYKEYFSLTEMQDKVMDPFTALAQDLSFDVKAVVSGGGYKGQAEALRMAISRALVKLSADNRTALKANKFLTRDAREVERKKFGKPKARKSFQFSKR